MVAAVLLGGGAAAAVGWVWSRSSVSTAGKVDFANPLAIPRLAPSEVDAEGRRVFDLTAAEGSHDFDQAGQTPTWGFNGDYLGPTLRARRGEEVAVNVHNELSENTSIHW